ncbi:MAG TPA: RNA-binding cell elongation regulator Jag/EloR [Acidimicrobiales bacterium]|nr:RNA-binding cell elongation regulator Jag/EloR [Acidimicrobiales bacterium]
MEWVVTTGRTVEEAKDAALDELGVDEHDAEFEILEEPKVGLFGRQRGEARVRARVRPSVPRPKNDRRDRRKRRTDGERAAAPERAGGGTERAGGGGERGGGRSRAPAPGRASTPGSAAGEGDEDAMGGDTAGEGGGPAGAGGAGRAPRRRGRGRGAQRGATVLAEGNGSDDDDDGSGVAGDDGGMMGEQELDLAQQASVAETFVRGLLERFSLSAETTTVTLDEETIEVQVSGAELGLLIGPKGQTLQAVQEMTRTAVQRRASNRTGRILVDVAGYRVKRREALERFTRQIADDVRASGVQRVLEPMSPADRKIVHDTANLIPGVRTISEGEEPQRRVVIVPDTGDQDEPPTADA